MELTVYNLLRHAFDGMAEYRRTILKIVYLVALLTLMTPAAFAATKWSPFRVSGEQLDFRVPDGWKLAWMSGKGDDQYLAEYLPVNENIDAWRGEYFSINRFRYPSQKIRDKIAALHSSVAAVALYQFIRKADATCGGIHVDMSQRIAMFNGVRFAVGGGYCSRYGSAAPFGEGSIVAFAEGEQYVFRVKYDWRPSSSDEQKEDLPWRNKIQKIKGYIESIKLMTLCGGKDEPVCKVSYVH